MKSTTCMFLGILTYIIFVTPILAENAFTDDGTRDFTQVYHVFDENDVDLVATVTYRSYDNPKITVKSVYPQLESDFENQPIDQFNELVKETVNNEIDDFKNQVKQSQEFQENLPKNLRKNTLNIDFNASVLTGGSEHILSIRLSMQAYIGGMAHPSLKHVVINYNLDTNQKMELSDLFTPDSDYLSILAEYANDLLSKRLTDKQMLMEGTRPNPENYKNWNLKPTGLLITFDETQVAPYVNGTQTVLIPYAKLKKIISPQSILAKCIRRKNCVRNHLLTGGFIDEA